MCALVIIGLVVRPQARVLRLANWISIALGAVYLINAAVIYLLGA
jgi:cation:H+ antiporter